MKTGKTMTAKAAAIFFLAAALGTTSFPAYGEETIQVEYDNLRQLLIEGNLGLQKATDSYETSKKNYQDLMEEMRQEQEYMKFLADKYEDTEDEMSYRMNASILGSQATQFSRLLKNMEKRSRTLSLEQTTDSYVITAETVMNSYNQIVLNEAAQEKRVEAKEAAYEAAVKKNSSGAATAMEVMEASDLLETERSLLASYRQEAGQLRFRLLSMLGLEDREDVVIGTVPEPDLAWVDQVNYDQDKEIAINNNRSVQNVRHSRASVTEEIRQKSEKEEEAVGNAEVDFLATYQQLQASRLNYQAALDGFESAKISFSSLQLRQQAGMLSRNEYLQGEADYRQALADKESAAMNLQQAMKDYQWAMKGQ